MTTVADRLKTISGLSGATVAAMLLAAGSGSTMAECLVSHSGLPTGTVVEHLLVDREVEQPGGGGGGIVKKVSTSDKPATRIVAGKRIRPTSHEHTNYTHVAAFYTGEGVTSVAPDVASQVASEQAQHHEATAVPYSEGALERALDAEAAAHVTAFVEASLKSAAEVAEQDQAEAERRRRNDEAMILILAALE